jgi:hypothetical protein
MSPNERKQFSELLTDALAFWRRDVSPFTLSVWWQACEPFSLEQVSKALTAHAMDPDQGRFAPMPADIVRQLQGSVSDRALVAWGRVLDATQRVGAYQSVVFDDPAIHAAIEDIGGWVNVCRLPYAELSHTERRFCESYRAYARRGDFAYPPALLGQHAIDNAAAGFKSAPPLLLGDSGKAQLVLQNGTSGSRQQVTPFGLTAVPRLRIAGATE